MMRARLERKGDAGRVLRRIASSITGPQSIKVGFPSGTGIDIVERATRNEFGTTGIPERPFFRNALTAHRDDYRRLLVHDGRRLLTGRMRIEAVMNRLGLSAVGHIQQSIVDLRTPPNSAQTIAAKGSSNPLIDTGEMRQSVTYIVQQEAAA